MEAENAILAFFVIALSILIAFNVADRMLKSSSNEVITLNLMHAQWCDYCQPAKENVLRLADEMPLNVNVMIWDESLRQSDERTANVYKNYKQKGLFGGFPTLVAASKTDETMLVGSHDYEELKSWVCSQYQIKPKQCEN